MKLRASRPPSLAPQLAHFGRYWSRMHRQLVSHAITVPRPLDWATVCAITPEAEKVAAKFNLTEPRFSRLMPKNDHITAQHSTRDRWEWDWKAPDIAILVEGWVEKE